MSLGRWFTLRRWVAGSRLDPRPRRPIRRADHAPRPGGFRLEWLEDRCLPTTYASTDVPKAVKDYTTVTSTLMVPNHFPITDVNLNLDIDHTATVDLDISLIGPDGTRVHVFDRQGGAGDNLHSTELDDQAPFPLSLGQPPFTGHFQPAEPLAAFNQHDAFGVWTLEVSDRDINDEGFVRGWSLTFGTNLAQTAFNVVEDRATWGQGVQVRYGVTNDGSAAAGPFTAQVVLSHDAAIDDTDPVLQELNFEDLAPQQWLSGATTVTLPGAADTPPPDFPAGGQVWLGIRIVPRDPGTTVAQPGSGVQPVGVIEDTLTLTQVAREVEPNGTPAAAMPIQPNAAISGSIAGQGDVDYYSFTLPEPSRVEARVTATPGSGLIPLLKLFGPDGKLLVQSAGANLVQQLPAGTYALSVSVAKGGSGSTHGGYLLATEAAQVAEEIPDRPVGGGVVDVNGDGHPDLVGHDPATLAGVLLLGNGDGTFQAPRPIGGGIFYLARVADVDGDGRPDLIYSPDLSGRSLVQLGNGDGTFQAPRSTGQSAFAVAAVADVNGDRRPDLLGVVSGPDPGTVIGVVQLGNGDGTFQAPRPTGGGYILAVADLNGDGRPDLVGSAPTTGTGVVQLGNGDGTFQAPRLAGVGRVQTVEDVNGDGGPDLISSDPATGDGFVQLGNGDGSFQPSRPTGGASIVADVDGDGRPDLLGGGTVQFGNGDGSFRPPRPTGSLSIFTVAAVADLNGDGRSDIIDSVTGSGQAVSTGEVLLGNGDGTFQAPRPIVASFLESAAVADVNGDGRPDLLGGGVVQLGNGDGTFQAPQPIGLNAVLAVADVNGDGRPDLIGSIIGADPTHLTGVVQLGNGDGTFQAPRPTGGGYILAVADLNGDGRPDLVGFGSLSGPGFVQLGNGDGTFQAPRPAGVGIAVVVADVNGDGRPDWIGYVVGADPAHPTGVVELGNGDGTFQAPRPVGGTFLGASAVADVNGDGRPDLLDFINDTGGLVLLGNGDGTFQAPRPVGVDFFGQPAVADVNGDGRPDLIGSGTHLTDVVLLGNGDGTFNRVRSNTAVKARSVPIRVDLDRDGTPDIAVLDGTGNILFRRGLAGTDSRYDPPVVVNPGRPARDLVPVRLPGGWALAAADARGDGVSLYSAGPGGTFIAGREFTAGTLPVRLAAADLNGDGRDDLVVAADLGRTLTVAFQGPDGRFTPGPVLPISREPSEIILTDLDGRDGPDIAVAEQGAGQVRVFYNDPQHSFAESARFRAGFGPYGFDTDPDIADVSALEQTVALVAGPFDAGGRPALVTVNRGSDRVNTLRVTRDGLAGPQPALSFLTGTAQVVNDEPGQAVAADFDRDGRPDLAVLMQDTAEVWVYHGHGDGTFTLLSRVPAGLQPTGLSAADVNGDGNADLLIGNGDGDVLFVLGNGDGTFHPFVRTDQRVPFVATARRDGFVDVVLADQADDQAVSLVHDPSSNAFTPGAFQRQGRDLIGPGAVAEADLDGKYGTDLIFANSGSNNVLVYLRQPDGSFADTPLSFFAGTNPVGLTVNDLNGNGLPDLVVADQGSNDVAILFGSVGSDGQWTFKYGPRLRTGGTGPNAVTVLPDQNGDGIPDLLVTNGQSGTLALLPGIGNQQGVGTGFFRDNAARVFQIADVPIVGTLPLPDSSRVIGLTRDGGLVGFDLAADAAFAVAPGFDRFATALAAFTVGDETFLAAASNDGVSLLGLDGHGNFAERALLTGAQLDDPSALQVLQLGGTFEVYVTNTGVPMPLELTFGPDALGLEVPGVSSVRDTPLALAATLLTTLVNPPEAGDVEQSSQPVFAAGLGGIGIGERLLAGIDGGGDEAEEAMAEQVPDQDAAELERFISGVEEALREFGWLTAEPAQAPPDGEGGAALDTPALLQPPGCPTAVVAAESQPGTLDAGPAPDVAAGSQPGDKGPTAAGPRDTVVGPVCQPARAPSRVRSDRAALPAEAAPDADDLPSAAGPLWWHLSLADLALVFVGTWGAMYVALDLSFSGSSDRGASGSLCHTVLPSPRRR